MQTSQLRRATSADVANIRALTRSAYAKWVPIIGREPMPMTADYNRAVADHIIDLWEERGQLLALEVIPASDHLLIENIAVRRDQQGKGLGDKLLHHAEELPVPWDSMRFSFTRMLRLLRTCHSILGADTKSIEEGRQAVSLSS